MTEVVKIKTKAVASNLIAVYILAAAVFAVLVSYIYFANVAVRALTTLEKTKQEMQVLSVKVSELESEKLVIENNISKEKVLSLGFVEVSKPTFIIKSSKSPTLSLKTDY